MTSLSCRSDNEHEPASRIGQHHTGWARWCWREWRWAGSRGRRRRWQRAVGKAHRTGSSHRRHPRAVGCKVDVGPRHWQPVADEAAVRQPAPQLSLQPDAGLSPSPDLITRLVEHRHDTAHMPTAQFAHRQQCQPLVCGHMQRPCTAKDWSPNLLSVIPAARWAQQRRAKASRLAAAPK